MNRFIIALLLVVYTFSVNAKNKEISQQPNILWILTDDHRYDAVRAFNKMLRGEEMSELGYVESPQIDRLTQMGTTFLSTFCQAQGCAPSRASMHTGRYPFRSGVYEFEYFNNKAPHWKPTLPEQMAGLGYQTLHIGKLGVRIKTLKNGRAVPYDIYQTDIKFKTMHKDGFTGWGKDWFASVDGKKLNARTQMDFFVNDKGEFEYVSLDLEKQYPEYAGIAQRTMDKYELIRHYTNPKNKSIEKGMIISGVSSRSAGHNRDGNYVNALKEYLNDLDGSYTIGSQTVQGIDPAKPLFCHLGFDFPHTPVLPPASYRERFKQHHYRVPEFDPKEFDTMPKQLKKQVEHGYSDHYSDEQKQAFVRDYYAFCAYGDSLVGEAVNAFIAYSEKHQQPWMIVYVNGDHGWKLNDHGAVSKFTPWEVDAHNPIVVVSSDKKKFPAGKVVRDFTEFVDIAPTILAAAGANLETDKLAYLDGQNMAKVVDGTAPHRDYVVGESHAVTGPRAFIRTHDWVFSMQTRPNKNRGENMDWARNATYEEVDPGLYHTSADPHEVQNLAFDPKYRGIAEQMKEKLMNIVLGDNRVEVGWGKKADGTEVYHSNFAPGAHDYRLKIIE